MLPALPVQHGSQQGAVISALIIYQGGMSHKLVVLEDRTKKQVNLKINFDFSRGGNIPLVSINS